MTETYNAQLKSTLRQNVVDKLNEERKISSPPVPDPVRDYVDRALAPIAGQKRARSGLAANTNSLDPIKDIGALALKTATALNALINRSHQLAQMNAVDLMQQFSLDQIGEAREDALSAVKRAQVHAVDPRCIPNCAVCADVAKMRDPKTNRPVGAMNLPAADDGKSQNQNGTLQAWILVNGKPEPPPPPPPKAVTKQVSDLVDKTRWPNLVIPSQGSVPDRPAKVNVNKGTHRFTFVQPRRLPDGTSVPHIDIFDGEPWFYPYAFANYPVALSGAHTNGVFQIPVVTGAVDTDLRALKKYLKQKYNTDFEPPDHEYFVLHHAANGGLVFIPRAIHDKGAGAKIAANGGKPGLFGGVAHTGAKAMMKTELF